MWWNKIVHDRLELEVVFEPKEFCKAVKVSSGILQVVVFGTIYTFVFSLGYLGLLLCCFEHCNNEISLPGDHSFVSELLLIKFDQDFVGLDSLVDTFDHREMIRTPAMVFVIIKNDVFHKIEL